MGDEVKRCEVCGREKAIIGESGCHRHASFPGHEGYLECYRIGYNNVAKVALKLSVEVSEQKARANAAQESLAAARRECAEQCEAKDAAYDRIYKALAALDADDLWSTRVINARAALAAPAAGEEGKT